MSIETFESALLEFSEKSCARQFFIRRDFPLRRLTSFRIGGNADAVVYPKDAEAFAFAVDQARRSETPYLILGNGQQHTGPPIRAIGGWCWRRPTCAV